jgi:hypothetical protein
LREAVSRVGRYYAKSSGLTGATDPVQYSCQRNFSIVTTDGYWNGAGGVRLDNSAIGNEDSSGMVIGGVTGPFSDGWTGTLADVAAFFYKTHMRPPPHGKGKVPNITPARLTWSKADVVEYLTSGFTPDYDSAGGHMALVIRNTAKLPQADRAAIAAYLARVQPAD